MVGKWQLPLADVAVTASSFGSSCGEAMAMGERGPVALIDGPASARLAVTESILNLIAAPIRSLDRVKLSANWMAPAGYPGNDTELYGMVETLGMDFCPALGLAIPVGKDSLSMQMVWQEDGHEKRVTSPASVVITAFSAVDDVRGTLTPVVATDAGKLIHVRVSEHSDRLGGSILAYCYEALGSKAPDVSDAAHLKAFVEIQQKALRDGDIVAYHDVSDGGLIVTALEMAFAAHASLSLSLGAVHSTASLFAEEPGAIVQAARGREDALVRALTDAGLYAEVVGEVREPEASGPAIDVQIGDTNVLSDDVLRLVQIWSETSFEMVSRRDNPQTAKEEFDALGDPNNEGLFVQLPFALPEPPPRIDMHARPAVAILRAQGVNGEVELAAAFDRAGFSAVDVHLNDVIGGKDDLSAYAGLAVAGGSSFGNVTGAGSGWADMVRYNAHAKQTFEAFFAREDRFTLGVCNGAQMLSELRELIPGSENWPRFIHNTSGAFEGRFPMVEIDDSASVLLAGMQGARLPVPLANGQGRAFFESETHRKAAHSQNLVAVHYVDGQGNAAKQYPENPTGAQDAVGAVCSKDGRVTLMIPHPERAFLTSQWSWHPQAWGENAPWLQLFLNAHKFADRSF